MVEGKLAKFLTFMVILGIFALVILSILSQLTTRIRFTPTPVIMVVGVGILVYSLILILRQTDAATDLDKLSKPLLVIAVLVVVTIFMVKNPNLFQGFSTAINQMEATMKTTPILNSII